MAMAWHEPERGEARPGATGKPIEALPGAPDGPLVLPEDRRRVAKRRSESPPGAADARERLTIRLRTSLTPEVRQLSDERTDDRRQRAQRAAAALRGRKPSERSGQRVVRLKVKVPHGANGANGANGAPDHQLDQRLDEKSGQKSGQKVKEKTEEKRTRPGRAVRAGRASFTPPASPDGSEDELTFSPEVSGDPDVDIGRGANRGPNRGPARPAAFAKKHRQDAVATPAELHSTPPDSEPKPEKKRGRKRQKAADADPDGEDHDTNDWCSACGGTGRILCCDSCSRSYHFTCAEPPIDQWRLPAEWFCRACDHAAGRDPPAIPGMFEALGRALDKRVPLSFQLPKTLREHFERVATDEHGDYAEQPLPKIDTAEIGLCYRCQSPANEPTHPLGTCERCGLRWHADCLPEPQSHLTLPTRWTCPLHADRTALLPRRPRKPVVTDVALARQVPNDGQIDVASDSESGTDEEEVVKTIPFLPVKDAAADYVSAPLPSRRRSDRIVYRLKERTIKLDFIDAVAAMEKDPWRPSVASNIMVELDEVAARPDREREAVRDLMQLSLQGPRVDKAAAELNLRALVDAALRDDHEQTQIAAIKRLMQVKGRERLLKLLSED